MTRFSMKGSLLSRLPGLLATLLAGALLPGSALAAADGSMPAGHPPFQPPADMGNQGFSGKVIEMLKASRYVYIQVDTGTAKHWVASPSIPVKVGDPVQVPAGMVMSDFESPELGRKFSEVYFVGGFQVGSGAMPAGHPPLDANPEHGPRMSTPTPSAEVSFDGLTKAPGGYTVEEIHAQAASLADSEVTVRGKIVKINNNILDRNWLHVQDGTGNKDSNDLVVTSKETAAVGDTVVVKGKLVTKADFGYGYTFGVLMEKASVTVEAADKGE